MNSTVGRILGIALCGAIGAIAAWWLLGWIALDGTPGALVAVGVAAVVATLAFAGWTTLARTLERGK